MTKKLIPINAEYFNKVTTYLMFLNDAAHFCDKVSNMNPSKKQIDDWNKMFQYHVPIEVWTNIFRTIDPSITTNIINYIIKNS